MKKSIITSTIIASVLLSLTLTSCSRKYGCYYALTPVTETREIKDMVSTKISDAATFTSDSEMNRIGACNP